MSDSVSSLDVQNDKNLSFTNKALNFFFPIRKNEISKFFLITGLQFSILFIQNLVRALKDSLVITKIGPETISFLKFWGVMPVAFLMSILYIKLVTISKSINIFYYIYSAFLLFFACFAFLIFPNHEYLHIEGARLDHFISSFPHFKWFILLLSNWGFSLFYIISELWIPVVSSLLFWQLVNGISTIDQSRRFYALFGFIGQTGLILSGILLESAAKLADKLIEAYGISTNSEIIFVQIIISCALFFGIVGLSFLWLINNCLSDAKIAQNIEFSENKKHLSISDSIRLVLSSRYILLVCALLICYGCSISLIEGLWKAKVSQLYSNSRDYTVFVGSYLKYNGVMTIVLALVASIIIRKFGWLFGALVTPIVLFITGMLFFASVNFENQCRFLFGVFAVSNPLNFAILAGFIQNVLSKSTKYSFFDSTKEMAYVPLDHEIKTKGKAAADIVGTKFGKSLSAFLVSMTFIIMPNAGYDDISTYIMVIFAFIFVIWIVVVFLLNKLYCKKIIGS